MKSNSRIGECSLVISTLNEQDSIISLLRSILSQEILPKETIIIDGGSNDLTIERIKQFKERHPDFNIQLYVLQGTIGKCKNFGIKKATTDNILSTDAGCILDKEFIKKFLIYLKKYDVIGGAHIYLPTNLLQRTFSALYSIDWDNVKTLYTFSNRCLAFKKRAWQKIGGYNEQIKRSEDTLICHRWKKTRVRMHLAKDVKVDYYSSRGLLAECRLAFSDVLRDYKLGLTQGVSAYRKLYLASSLFYGTLIFALTGYYSISLVLVVTVLLYMTLRAIRVLKRNNSVLCALYSYPVQIAIDFMRIAGLTSAIVNKWANCIYSLFRI